MNFIHFFRNGIKKPHPMTYFWPGWCIYRGMSGRISASIATFHQTIIDKLLEVLAD